MKRLVLLGAIAVLASCGKTNDASDKPKVPDSGFARTYKSTDTTGQAYSITTTDVIPKADLPGTNTMKLLGGDAVAYIKRACLDAWQASRCDVYAQPDLSGTLAGYLTISVYPTGPSFDTDTMTTPLGTGSKACGFGGGIEGEDLNVTGDFRGRSMFETTDDRVGMIYLERAGDNIRMTDERWNYCYDERHIDDVYYLIGSFVRDIDKSKWPTAPRP